MSIPTAPTLLQLAPNYAPRSALEYVQDGHYQLPIAQKVVKPPSQLPYARNVDTALQTDPTQNNTNKKILLAVAAAMLSVIGTLLLVKGAKLYQQLKINGPDEKTSIIFGISATFGTYSLGTGLICGCAALVPNCSF